jgi:hypothetical protein
VLSPSQLSRLSRLLFVVGRRASGSAQQPGQRVRPARPSENLIKHSARGAIGTSQEAGEGISTTCLPSGSTASTPEKPRDLIQTGYSGASSLTAGALFTAAAEDPTQELV